MEDLILNTPRLNRVYKIVNDKIVVIFVVIIYLDIESLPSRYVKASVIALDREETGCCYGQQRWK